MLLEKVFFNLMDNSLRHGTDVTVICISSYAVEDGHILVYRDKWRWCRASVERKDILQGIWEKYRLRALPGIRNPFYYLNYDP